MAAFLSNVPLRAAHTRPALRSRFTPSTSTTPTSRRRDIAASRRTPASMVLDSPPASPTDLALMDSVNMRRRKSSDDPVAIVVLGASGDLAKKKTFPAIFSLFYHGFLPRDFVLIGFARSAMTDAEFRDIILATLSCRVIDGRKCSEKMDEFLPKCFYHRGDYSDPATFTSLDSFITERATSLQLPSINRLFYLAIPPKVFSSAASLIDAHARTAPSDETVWTRVVVEKPFGHDLPSYQVLKRSIADVLTEAETFRIDHFLAKEVIQNLMILRFANSIFEPLWNRNYIDNIQVTFKENFGVEGRAGYFDNIGIIRDIMQNHLLQMLSLLTMEIPSSLSAEDIRNEKVKALRSITPLTAENFTTGQYCAANVGGEAKIGYLDDDGIDQSSVTPTYATCILHVNNARWDGVPLLMRAGKATDERKTEIRVQFKNIPGSIFADSMFKDNHEGASAINNELVIRVQPDEAIYLKILSKVPGLTSKIEQASLNLFYKQAWDESKDIPDAYERLILDVIQGEKSLFIRDDELEVSWRIFTPALNELESSSAPKPELYDYGSSGPQNSRDLAAKFGVTWSDTD